MTSLPARIRDLVWRVDSVKGPLRAVRDCVRVTALALKGFNDDLCVMRASTLTFYTLLSIVPVLATAFGIAKGFGLHRLLQRQLTSQVAWVQELMTFLLRFASVALENARGGVIAGIGVIAFFVSVIGLLGATEDAFNAIWKVDRPRSLGRKSADYLSVVLIGTVLLSVVAGVHVFISANIRLAAEKVSFLVPLSQGMLAFLQLIPFAVTCLLFTFLYLFMPNTAVPFLPGLIAGVCSAALFQLAQWAYVTSQVGVSGYNAVYGSFAALPLFLVWMQASWTIVLLGGEIATAIVNSRTYGFFPDYRSTSPYLRTIISSAIVTEIKQAFTAGLPPPTAEAICASVRIPRQFFDPLARRLIEAGIVSEVIDRRGSFSRYQPALPPGRISLTSVERAVAREGQSSVPPFASERLKAAEQRVSRLEDEAARAAQRLEQETPKGQ